MKIGIYQNLEHDATSIINTLKAKLEACHLPIDNENPDVVFFIGGDGTLLKAVQHYFDKLDVIKFIGINNGRLGFFYDFVENDINEMVDALKDNKLTVMSHKLIKADILFVDGKKATHYALNEVRIENPFRTLTSEVFIDDQYLETFRGNGLVVCSSLGSSAYNRSLGGAIINPTLDLLEITEIASIQNNIYRSLGSSLVLSGKDVITFKGPFEHVVFGFDNSIGESIPTQEVKATLSDKTVTLYYSKSHSYIRNISKSFVR